MGRLHSTNSELNLLRAQTDEAAHSRSNTWLTKTLSSLRDATKVKSSTSVSSGMSSVAAATAGHPPPNSADGPADRAARRGSSRDIYHS